jgi:hypothetical protein
MLKFSSFCLLLALTFICRSSFAQNGCGYDISTQAGAITTKNINCMRAYCLLGLNFMVLELMDSFGHLNPNFLANYQTVQSAKVKSIDIYLPFTDLFTPTEICDNITNNVPSGFTGTVWLYVQSAGWLSTNTTANLDFIVNVAEECETSGLNVGIGSSNTTWAQITGNATNSYLQALPLWDINDDNIGMFSDWNYSSFGGWKQPTQKQYSLDSFFVGCLHMPPNGVNSDIR